MSADTGLLPHPLTHALMIITNQCNARCAFCQFASMPSPVTADAPTGQWIDAIAGLREAGAGRVVISGGEPLLHKGFNDIARFAAALMDRVIICTNGILLDAPAMHLSERPSLQWNISLHGADAATHDRLTGISGAFDRITGMLNDLTKRGLPSPIAINTTCHDALTDYRPLIRLAERLQARQLTINPVWNKTKGNCHANAHNLSQAFKDRAYAEERGLRMIDLRIPDVITPPGCYEVLTGMLINPSGECFPCMNAASGFYPDNSRSFGNVFQKSIGTIRSSQQYRTFCRQGYRRSNGCCTTCHAPVRRSSLYEYLKSGTSGIPAPVQHNINKAVMPQGGKHYG